MCNSFISPSLLASYFYYDCPRQLRYGMMPSAQRQAAGLPPQEYDSSPIMTAIFDAGSIWEEQVIESLGNQVHIPSGDAPLRDRCFSPEETLHLLESIQPGEYIYQATFTPPALFYTHYGLDPNEVQISTNYPDLIECLAQDDQRLFRIIDIKRGESLSVTYKMQVLVYALQLESILQHYGIHGEVDTYGGIWLGNTSAYEPFSLTHIRSHIEQFFQQELMPLASSPPEAAFWHINFRCERCGWFEHCLAQARETNDLSRLTKLTGLGKQYLHEQGIFTLEDLGHFLESPNCSELLKQCASLKGERHYLKNKVQAYCLNQPIEHGSASPALPIREDIALTLTIQKEPLGRNHYLVGLYAEPNTRKARDGWGSLLEELADQVYPNGQAAPVIFLAQSPDQTEQIRRNFIRLLVQLLEKVDQYNGSLEWQDRLSLQCYVNTTLEKRVLEHWLLAAISDPEVSEAAMRLLLWFQAPELLALEDHPQDHLPYPLVSLQQTLALVLAMPVDMVYTLWDSLPALGSGFNYQHRSYYHYRLAQSLQPQAIHAAWYLGETDKLLGLEREARLYLYALKALRDSIRSQVSPTTLFNWPEKFRMPRVANISDPNLSRLAFFARYEQMVEYESVRNMRSAPRDVQLEQGYALLLEAQSSQQFCVVEPANMPLESNQFGYLLLARDTDQGRREQLAFNDKQFADKVRKISKDNICRVTVGEVIQNDEAQPVTVFLKEPAALKEAEIAVGDRFLLLPCYTDFNTNKVISTLERLDQEGAGLFGQLLENPACACASLLLNPQVNEILGQLEGSLGLSSSQVAALQAIRTQRATCVWGPPGTGKTHFLGVLLLALAHAYAQAGLPLRILVTGQSHYAIENVLRKVLTLQSSMPNTSALRVIKAGSWSSEQPSGGLSQEPEKLETVLREMDSAIVGATVYATWKAIQRGNLQPFDLVVIDEASQVRVAESAIPISLVSEQGRLVLAGDDYQLPPIVKGDYPAPPAGQYPMYGSIFELLASSIDAPEPVERATAVQNVPYFRMLLENRRMNGVINNLASTLLYGPSYQPATPEIASQRLRYTPSLTCSEFIQRCLDPTFPIVIALVESPRATNENQVEAAIVHQLVMELHQGLCNDNDEPYEDDTFFKQGVFVVCPHRAQNHLVRRLLSDERDWEPRSDTVDKMQGQEAEAVIVSYGVSDPEYAAQEAEFIYSRNRLNVAITRAKCKCVIILSTQLLNAPPSVWENSRASEGLGFMRGVVQYVRHHGEACNLVVGEVPIELLRVSEVTA